MGKNLYTWNLTLVSKYPNIYHVNLLLKPTSSLLLLDTRFIMDLRFSLTENNFAFWNILLVYASIAWEDKSVYDIISKVDINSNTKIAFNLVKYKIKWLGTSYQSLFKLTYMLRRILSPMIYHLTKFQVLGECGFWVIWRIVMNNLWKPIYDIILPFTLNL